MSLECDSVEVVEDVGGLEMCARLVDGVLAIDIDFNGNTQCGTACCKCQGCGHLAFMIVCVCVYRRRRFFTDK